MSELKPCPFCGTTDFIVMHNRTSHPSKDCHLNGCIIIWNEASISPEQQIEVWNTRQSPKAMSNYEELSDTLRDMFGNYAKHGLSTDVFIDSIIVLMNNYVEVWKESE